MFTEDELLPISALQHLEFCPRRCALVHLEGVWADNAQTAEGRALHQRVHGAPSGMDHGVRVARGLRLCSLRLGLFGVADVVEFHPREGDAPGCLALPVEGSSPQNSVRWLPFPVEYKRGRRKSEMSYFVQLCAQALCLEEMLGAAVPAGALYHGKSHHRQQVVFDAALRGHTEALAHQLHELIAAGRTPPPQPGPKCRYCSLAPICVPKLSPSRSARQYVLRQVEAILAE